MPESVAGSGAMGGGPDTSAGDSKGPDEEDTTVPEFSEPGNIQSPHESPNMLSDVPVVCILQVRNRDWLATLAKRWLAHSMLGFDCSADPVASSVLPSDRMDRTSASIW